MATTPRNPARRCILRLCAGVAVVVASAAVAGCRDPLVSGSQIRSPFQRYDRIRNQDAEAFVRDEFGRQRPNIAGRLAPR
ncbi:MAG: hypothetical protein AAFX79_04920 [Planctomycetota bacterium]